MSETKRLSMIISMALKKSEEEKKEEARKEELLNFILKALEKADFSRDELIMRSDDLYLFAREKIGAKKLLEGLRLLAYSAFGYFVAGDIEHFERVVREIEQEVEKAIKELEGWGEFDKAFLLWTLSRLVSEARKEKYEEPAEYANLKNVFPYIRDVLKILVLAIHRKIPEDFLAQKLKRYEEYCEKKGLLNYWEIVKEIFERVRKIKEMEEAYAERAGFEKLS